MAPQNTPESTTPARASNDAGKSEAKAPPPRNRTPIGIIPSVVLSIVVVGLLLWKFLSYAPFVLPSAVALAHIILKDWKNYDSPWKRWPILGVVLLAGIGGIAYQSRALQEKAEGERRRLQEKAVAEARNKWLSDQVVAMSRELSDLKTNVATEALQNRISSLQSKLEDTQRALNQPKASLTFTFVPFTPAPFGQTMKPSIAVTLARNTEGVVHVEFTVYNPTDIPAIDGELTLQICDQCKFAKEPPGFKHLPGQLDTQRIMLFDRLLPTTAFPIMSADIIVLDRINRFPIGMWSRCRTCVVRAPSEGIIHIAPTAQPG